MSKKEPMVTMPVSMFDTLESKLTDSKNACILFADKVADLEATCDGYDKMALRSNELNSSLLAENKRLREWKKHVEYNSKDAAHMADEHMLEVKIK